MREEEQERKNNEREEEPQNQDRSKTQCRQRNATTHPRRHIHLNHTCNNRSSARKRDIQLIRIKQGRITKVGRRYAEFIFNELGGCGCEWEGGVVVVLPGRGYFR